MLSSKNFLTRHWVNDVYGRHPMSSGEFIPLLYGVVLGEAFLLGEATDTQLGEFASLAGRHVV